MTPRVANEFEPESETLVQRFREVGDLTLDLVHSDGRVEDSWLSLSSNEFSFLWRLAEEPGRFLPVEQWLVEEAGSTPEKTGQAIEARVAQLREKLRYCELGHILDQDRSGCLRLEAPPGPSTFR